MASKMTRIPLMRAIQARTYASVSPVSGYANADVKTTVLPNKLIVASAENSSPLCRVSIQFRAGSRNEGSDNGGTCHVLRIAAGLSTSNSSQFAIIRNIQQVGASLSCSVDREVISYTIEGTRKAVEDVMPFLTSVATQQVFKPWELSDQVPRIRIELATRPPQQRAVDLLHKAAYRRGLGNSIFIAKHQIGKVNTESLQHYVRSNFVSGRAAVIGLGVDHTSLTHYAQSLQIENGSGTICPSPYFGGEIRSDKGGDYAFVAIGVEGSGANNLKEAVALEVLKKALGDGVSVKRGTSNSALGKACSSGNSAISALNVIYGDSGVFGVLVAAPAAEAGSLVQAAVKTIKSANVSEEDVNRGKNQLLLELLSSSECGTTSTEMMGREALLTGNVSSMCENISLINSITSSDVNNAASKVASGKLSIAAVGNLCSVPFLDELK